MNRRLLMHWIATAMGAQPLMQSAFAAQFEEDSYPKLRPIRWVVPYPPGGGSDTKARAVAGIMRNKLGQDLMIENRPGAATNIAAETVARSDPDGYTVMTADNAILFLNEHLFPNLRYSPANDFSYIGTLGRFPLVLVVSKHFPAKTFAEFMRQAHAQPDKVSYASAGNGSPHHLAMELFKGQTGLRLRHIPYQGAAPAMIDLMSGMVDAMFLDLASGLGLMRERKINPLAIAAAKRSQALPQLPTFHDLNQPDLEVFSLQGLLGPANMPRSIVNKLHDALSAALAEQHVHQRMSDFGTEFLSLSPMQFKQVARAEAERWGKIIRQYKIKID